MRCDGCGATLFRKEVEREPQRLPRVRPPLPVSAVERIAQLLDADTFEEWYADLLPGDPLGFNDRRPYPDRVKAEQERTGLNEAAVVGQGFIKGIRVVFGVTDSGFIMGSMGSVVGEKLTRAIEEATRQKLPVVIVSGSGGGARMHEGIFSLMQMAKVSAALARHHAAGGLYISVLTHPTMGGVAASFASLGDMILAEPKALIGFAGPKVIAADRPRPAPRGLPDQRVPPEARVHRPDRPPPRPAGHARPADRLRLSRGRRREASPARPPLGSSESGPREGDRVLPAWPVTSRRRGRPRPPGPTDVRTGR